MAFSLTNNTLVPPATTAKRHVRLSSPSSWLTVESSSTGKSRGVSIFWDLDNKPSKCSPYQAALHLRRVASQFGQIVDLVAYGNQHAFLHNPRWLQEENRSNSSLSSSDCIHAVTHLNPNPNEGFSQNNSTRSNLGMYQGPLTAPLDLTQNPKSSSYMCAFCGLTCATHKNLKNHYRLSHRREWRSKILSSRLHDGYGLYSELLRAGFYVRRVDHKPQAADRAIKRQIKHAMDNGVQCICLISDDSDFSEILKAARSRHVLTVVIGDTTSLVEFADIWYPWNEVSLGKGDH